MVDAVTDDQLWVATYNEPYANIFDTQSRIAKGITEALKIQMSPAELDQIDDQPTNNLIAWDYFKR